jgi:hypothetical protein
MPYLYALQMLIPDYPSPIKIGFSLKPADRLPGICGGLPFPTSILGVWRVDGQYAETVAHKSFASYRLNGEWFYPAPALLQYIDDNSRQYAAAEGAIVTRDSPYAESQHWNFYNIAAKAEGRRDMPWGEWDSSTASLNEMFDRSRVSHGALKSGWRI